MIELKNVTMAVGGCAVFPDSVSTRAQKHLLDLLHLHQNGYGAEIVFVVQRDDCQEFAPADFVDAEYGVTLRHVMAGGVHDTLPQALARCGYRYIMFYPMLRHFLGSGRFFEAAGIGEIFDAKAQRAKLPNERDRFYYANALAEIGRHVRG